VDYTRVTGDAVLEGELMKYVYIYRDPVSNVVRYVGSGSRKRMIKHTQDGILEKGGCEFHKWLASFGEDDWNRGFEWKDHRRIVAGPLVPSEAVALESKLIRENLDTVFNKVCPVTKEYLNKRATNRLRGGAGIQRRGNRWVASCRGVWESFPTFCAALKWRKAREAVDATPL